MPDKSFSGGSSKSMRSHDRGKEAGAVCGCAVPEAGFPRSGKCYVPSETLAGAACHPVCDCCSIWTSPPDSESLAVTHIFKCSLCGYDKRVKTEAGNK